MSGARLPFTALTIAALLLSVRTLEPWAGLAFLGLLGAFVLAGASLAHRWALGIADPVVRCCYTAVVGMALAMLLFCASALAFKTTTAGSLVLVALAALGAWRIWRGRGDWLGASPAPAAVLSAALALGLYLVGYNEILEGDHLGYTYRWDWDSHLFWAQLLAHSGLPLTGSTGSPATPFSTLTHTGHLSLIAGTMQFSRLGPYTAARNLAVLAFAFLGVTSFALVVERTPNARVGAFAGLAVFVWGGLALPIDLLRGNGEAILDPYFASAFPMASASGAHYHNLTQLLSLTFGAAALLAVRAGPGGSASPGWAGFLLGASSLMKPSTALVLAPGLLLLAACMSRPVRAIALFAAGLAPAVALYLAPAFMAHLPPGPGVALVRPGAVTVARLLVFVGASGFLVARSLSRWSARPRSGSVVDALALGVCVGAVVDTFLSETAHAYAGNTTWGLAAALALLAPHVVAAVFEPTRRRLRWAFALLVALHLASGVLYAARYPWLRWREVQLDVWRALAAVRAATAPRAAVLVDLSLTPQAAAPYLARRAPLPLVNLLQPAEIADHDLWLQISRGESIEKLPALLSGRSAVVLGPRTRTLRAGLREAGWRRDASFTIEDYELWRPRRAP